MPSAPTKEQGSVHQSGPSGLVSWSALISDLERAPELRWPTSIETFRRMRNDAQVDGLVRGTLLPITRFRWSLDPNGAGPATVERIAANLRLPVQGQDTEPQLRRRARFSFDKHLPVALKALVYGHYFFEQVGSYDEGGAWNLRKLAPRPPRTITDIQVAPDGGLVYVKQGGFDSPEIPVDHLVAYVWDQDPGEWFGRSLLRPCFANWLIKDRLMRVDATKHERNGMGVPIAEAPEAATNDQINDLAVLATRARSGEWAGGAIPHGSKFTFQGVQGSVPDTVASLRWHDEQMARAFLMMFMQLGSTETGSRALGSEFIDFFAYAQESVADWLCSTFNEHVIEDDVDWNEGPDAQAPLLVYERSKDEELPTSELATLVEKGIVTVDPELEESVRKRYKLPARSDKEVPAGSGSAAPAPEQVAASTPPRGSDRRRVRAALSLPERELRREPYEHEVRASVDFAAIETTVTTDRDALVAAVQELQGAQIEALAAEIEDADGDLEALAALSAAPFAAAAITEAMRSAYGTGAAQVAAEAGAQGVTSPADPDPDELSRLLERADPIDRTIAQALAQAASQKALALSGGALSASQVASAVAEHLRGLSTAYLDEQLGGALVQAQNGGRRAVMRANDPDAIYASALLDVNTCDFCLEWDGQEFASLDEAEAQFPVGGNLECEGGLRCRCTVVAEWRG